MASTISRIGQHRRRPRWLAQGLDDLLARRPGQAATWLSWLRNAPQSPAERNRSEEHTSELQSLMRNSYAAFCLKKQHHNTHPTASHGGPHRLPATPYNPAQTREAEQIA